MGNSVGFYIMSSSVQAKNPRAPETLLLKPLALNGLGFGVRVCVVGYAFDFSG